MRPMSSGWVWSAPASLNALKPHAGADGRGDRVRAIAQLACAAGGSDIDAHPWTLLEADAHDVRHPCLRSGHI